MFPSILVDWSLNIMVIYGTSTIPTHLSIKNKQTTKSLIVNCAKQFCLFDNDTLTQIAGPEHDIVLSRIISENMVCGILPN
jgi:hypothetical protein